MSVVSHGSGAGSDPNAIATAQSSQATEGMQQATTDNVEWSLSESSPGQPAMARPAMERPGGDLPPSGRFRRSPASSTSRGRTRLTMRSPSTNGKRNASRLSPLARRPPARMDSPAVERVEISRHRVVRPELSLGTAGPDAVESRLAALEQQQSFDHKYLEQIAAAVRSLRPRNGSACAATRSMSSPSPWT